MNKAVWNITLIAGLLVVALLACARAPAAPEPDQATLEAAIGRWNKAVNAQDAAELTVMMTADVELLDNSTTATGPDAAVRTLREVARHGRLIAMTREIRIVDDLAWHVVGITQTQPNGDVQARGQALEIWKRVNGQWKLHRRMASAGGAPEISLTRPATKEPVLDRPAN